MVTADGRTLELCAQCGRCSPHFWCAPREPMNEAEARKIETYAMKVMRRDG